MQSSIAKCLHRLSHFSVVGLSENLKKVLPASLLWIVVCVVCQSVKIEHTIGSNPTKPMQCDQIESHLI